MNISKLWQSNLRNKLMIGGGAIIALLGLCTLWTWFILALSNPGSQTTVQATGKQSELPTSVSASETNPTALPSPTSSPQSTATPLPTNTPTAVPTNTPHPTETPPPTNTPTAVPTNTPPEPTATLNSAATEATFLAELDEIAETYSASLSTFDALTRQTERNSRLMLDNEWRSNVQAELRIWHLTAQRVRSLMPPDRLKWMYNEYLAFANTMDDAAYLMADGINELDQDKLTRATELINTAMERAARPASQPTPLPTATPTSQPSITPRPTATPKPRPTDTPIVPGALNAVVTARGLSVRAGPGVEYERIGAVGQGTELLLSGRDRSGTWAFGLAPAEGLEGWLSTGYMQISGNITSLPIEYSQAASQPETSSLSQQEYASQMYEIAISYLGAMETISSLSAMVEDDPLIILTDSWRNAYFEALSVLRDNGQLVREVQPPPHLRDVHQEVLEAARRFESAADWATAGLEEYDADKLERAITEINLGGAAFTRASDKLEPFIDN